MRKEPIVSDPVLDELATRHGVHRSYVGSDARRHRVDADVVRAVLGAMGVAAATPAEAAGSLAENRRLSEQRPLEPVLVQRVGTRRRFTVTLPEAIDPHDAWVTLELEHGEARRDRLSSLALRPSTTSAGRGQRLARHQVAPVAPRDAVMPAGYHRVSVEAPGLAFSALLVVAPKCPPAVRGWGTFLPLYALRTEDDWGVGSYGDLGELGRWTQSSGGSMVGTLPLYPVLPEPPLDPSPYLPASRLAYNELYVDPTVQPEFDAAPEALRVLDSTDFRRRLATARLAPLVDYDVVLELRRQVLEPMTRALFAGPSRRRDALESFLAEHPELAAYARFRAARDVGRRWSTSDTTVVGGVEEEALHYHRYTQWAAAEQLGAAAGSAKLYADLPIGVHPDGFDPRWEPASFATGAEGGAPPDDFYAEGQSWGFPPLHPERMRANGYRYVVASLRRAFAHAACLRVDHVMGLHRLYWVPSGFDARHGTYVNYRSDELRALVALEAHRAGAVVVGEDLGTVPAKARRAMTADRMLRSWVLQFETSAEHPLPSPPSRVLASWGTHDLPRFAAFFMGDDIAEAEQRGALSAARATLARQERLRWRRSLCAALGAPGDPSVPHTPTKDEIARAYAGCLAHLAAGDADLVLVDLEDTWGERAPQNRPGTGPEEPNWRRRSAYTLAELQRSDPIAALLAEVDRLRAEGPRPPHRSALDPAGQHAQSRVVVARTL